MYSHTYSKSIDQPGKVANPARSQLNNKNEYFPVRVRSWEFGLARRVRQSRPAAACSSPFSGWIWCLRGSSRVPRRRPIIYLKPPYAIGSQSRIYRVTHLRTNGVHCRESAGTGLVKPQGCSEWVLPWEVTMDQLICASLSNTHYCYRVGMLRVPDITTMIVVDTSGLG